MSEIKYREIALIWWNNLDTGQKVKIKNKYHKWRAISSLTGREIHAMYDYEANKV